MDKYPMCCTCRWWKPDRDTPDKKGRCLLYGHHVDGFPELKINVPGDDSTVLETDSDFGCVQWEVEK